MKIYDLMTSQPHVVDKNETILHIAQKMQTLGCGIFPVIFSNKISGVITDRDIINRVISNKLNIETTYVKDVMTKNVIYCYEDDSITRAVYLMNTNKIRRILVINDDHKLVGILSIIDVFKRLKDKSILNNLYIDTGDYSSRFDGSSIITWTN